MSLSGALNTGISALRSTSSALGVIADNIGNMESLSYKKRQAMFSSMVVGASNEATLLTKSHVKSYVNSQGKVSKSGVNTHMAVFGQGFFLVKSGLGESRETTFTRLGTFEADDKGHLVNHLGFYLQGVNVRGKSEEDIKISSQDLSETEPIMVKGLLSNPKATENINISAVFNSKEAVESGYTKGNIQSGTKEADFKTSVEIYDSKGDKHKVNIGFIKTAASTWSVEIYPSKSRQLASGSIIAGGDITFDNDGTVNTIASGIKSFTINWAPGLNIASQKVNLDFKSLLHVASPSRLEGRVQHDGRSMGRLNYLEIRENGVVEAFFDNGEREAVYKIPIATFTNSNQLVLRWDGTYAPGSKSGMPYLSFPGDPSAGKLMGFSLEKSNVEVADEFAELIKIRRNSSAASKVVSAADRMMEELVQLIRS